MNSRKSSSPEPEDFSIDNENTGENGAEASEETTQEAVAEKDPVAILKEELQKKEGALAEQKNEFLRYQADTENFKKRMQKEKDDFSRFANEKLLKEVVQIKDNLERALAAPNPTVESLKQGVDMILKQFDSFLDKENVAAIPAVGKKFDPSWHEVLCQVESDEHEENTITEEYSKGYHLNGRILRPSMVVVSKLPDKGSSKPAGKPKSDKEDAGEDQEPTAPKDRKPKSPSH